MFDCLVCSPPYSDAQHTDRRGADHPYHMGKFNGKLTWGKPTDYIHPSSEGQLGAMRPGSPCETPMNEVQTLEWTKDECYADSWQGLITPESFAHPAKMARGQLFRLVRWLFETGRVKKGDTLIDPFGGVSTTAIAGASAGLKVVTCELEEKFYRLGAGYDCPGMTKKEWVRYYGRWSRVKKFCEHCQKGPKVETRGVIPEVHPHRFVGNVDLHRRVWDAAGDPQPTCLLGDSRRLAEVAGPVLAQCVLSSPPFVGVTQGTDTAFFEKMEAEQNPGPRKIGRKTPPQDYGSTPGNLGNLPPGDALASGVVSSPPYEESLDNILPRSEDGKDNGAVATFRRTGQWPERRAKGLDYGTTEGNVGNTSGETFWSAARQIVSQCHLLLKPGATTAWVVKSYVKAGKVVPFPDQWAALLESTGFKVTHRIRCHLVSETREADLFGGETVKRTKKVSFFRRLHEKKRPDLAIDFEEIVVAVKVGEGGSAGAVVSSPPYSEGLGHGGSPTRGCGRGEDANLDAMQNGYGHTAGQLGGMKPGTPPRRCNQCGKGDDGCQCCFLEE